MNEVPLLQIFKTLADLKAAYNPTGNALILGKTTVGDGLGGFYYWDPTNTTATEDTKFLNMIVSSVTNNGRWTRVFQKAQTIPQGYMVNNGGVKTLYCPATTNSSGQCTIYLTNDGTATGTALFSEVWQVTPAASPTATIANPPLVGYGQASSDLKTLSCTFSQNNSTTLGATLLNIAGTLIKGLTPVPSGVPVLIKVEGV